MSRPLDARTIAKEIAANPDEVRRLRLSRLAVDVGDLYWYSYPGRFGRLRALLLRPFSRLWFRLIEKRLYRAWVKGYEQGRWDRPRRARSWHDECTGAWRK